ncbi:coiled-coil domain-containing protein 66 [Xenentodon cancila]
MNLGDGLLFELDNGKPRLILLSHGIEKNPSKLSVRSRAANVLSSRQPSCLEEVRGGEHPLQQLLGKHREGRLKTGGAAPSTSSNTTTTEDRSTILTSSKTLGLHEGSVKAVAKVKSNKHKPCKALGPLKVNGRAGHPQTSGTRGGAKTGFKDEPSSGNRKPEDRVVCLTSEQLQQILSTVQTSSNDEQVAQKQQRRQCSLPDRPQGGEKAESVSSFQSSVSHREQPAAIRSSLRLGEVTPMEEVLTAKSKEEQRRRWLEELDRQREETTERRKREKLLQSRTEDHERWAKHFDSLQRRPPVQAAAPSALPPVQLSSSEHGELEPWSSLSLVWEATSSCGAESVVGASVDSTGAYPIKTSYLRTMTSLLDPAQIEERERRRLKQLEQQRVIEAQMEEGRKRRQQEEAKRRQEEEEDERRVAMEREMLQRQYELEVLKKSQKKRPPPPPLGADGVRTLDIAVQSHTPPSPSAAPLTSRSRALRTGKENICLPAGGDVYEAFARTERSRRERRRPEWNKQRPSHRFVPASERYPVVQQKNRQESRLKRQAELLALQEGTRLSKAEPAPQHQETRLRPDSLKTRTSPPRKVETGSITINAARGCSPPIPAATNRTQRQHAATPPPALKFVPYVRTDEVFKLDPLDPLDPADVPPLHRRSGAPPQSSASGPHQHLLLHPPPPHNRPTQRQQEILRRLAELRQSLLQKQRELETEPNPPLKGQHT